VLVNAHTESESGELVRLSRCASRAYGGQKRLKNTSLSWARAEDLSRYRWLPAQKLADDFSSAPHCLFESQDRVS
jgi:hypothetical protein